MTCRSSKACGVGLDRPDMDSGTGLRKRIRGTLPSISMNDDLCDYRDVQRRDVAALLDAAVDANAFGKAEPVLWPGRWREARHEVFGVEAGFHCPAGDSELILDLGERLAAGDTQLPFDQILSGNRFRKAFRTPHDNCRARKLWPVSRWRSAATASSRSRISASAPLAATLSKRSGRSPATKSKERSVISGSGAAGRCAGIGKRSDRAD